MEGLHRKLRTLQLAIVAVVLVTIGSLSMFFSAAISTANAQATLSQEQLPEELKPKPNGEADSKAWAEYLRGYLLMLDPNGPELERSMSMLRSQMKGSKSICVDRLDGKVCHDHKKLAYKDPRPFFAYHHDELQASINWLLDQKSVPFEVISRFHSGVLAAVSSHFSIVRPSDVGWTVEQYNQELGKRHYVAIDGMGGEQTVDTLGKRIEFAKKLARIVRRKEINKRLSDIRSYKSAALRNISYQKYTMKLAEKKYRSFLKKINEKNGNEKEKIELKWKIRKDFNYIMKTGRELIKEAKNELSNLTMEQKKLIIERIEIDKLDNASVGDRK